MKFAKLQILSVVLTLLTAAPSFAQTTVKTVPVIRGKVILVNPQSRVMTVAIENRRAPALFYSVEHARIQTVGGRTATLTDLRPGTVVTVQYVPRESRWYPQQILIPDPNLVVPATSLSAGEKRALDSNVANDGDITTNPGVKARIDNDVTTQPGEKDPRDPDITKRSSR